MARLILVPQYPAKLRYQEWWFFRNPIEYSHIFDDVVVLGDCGEALQKANSGAFAPIETAVKFELEQMRQYAEMTIRDKDILLLCDLSFPGMFSNLLYLKRPQKCFAICHATSKNKYDLFESDRKSKWKVEDGTAQLFNKIFVATEYHKKKLGWKNIEVVGMPLPPFPKVKRPKKKRKIISVARSGVQKRTRSLEKLVPNLEYPVVSSWGEYLDYIAASEKMLITSKEETFGYQVVDAWLNGCIPIAPNAFSYPELLHSSLLYNNADEMLILLNKTISHFRFYMEYKCSTFYKTTARIMQEE